MRCSRCSFLIHKGHSGSTEAAHSPHHTHNPPATFQTLIEKVNWLKVSSQLQSWRSSLLWDTDWINSEWLSPTCVPLLLNQNGSTAHAYPSAAWPAPGSMLLKKRSMERKLPLKQVSVGGWGVDLIFYLRNPTFITKTFLVITTSYTISSDKVQLLDICIPHPWTTPGWFPRGCDFKNSKGNKQ